MERADRPPPGGGNFGVVTTFEFQLHPIGPIVDLGLFFWDLARGTEAPRACRDFAHELSENFNLVAGLNAPPAPSCRHEYPSRRFALVLAGFAGSEQHAAQATNIPPAT